MSEKIKNEERENLLHEVEDMYLGETSAAGIANPSVISIVACGPVITLVTRGVYCPINTINTIKK